MPSGRVGSSASSTDRSLLLLIAGLGGGALCYLILHEQKRREDMRTHQRQQAQQQQALLRREEEKMRDTLSIEAGDDGTSSSSAGRLLGAAEAVCPEASPSQRSLNKLGAQNREELAKTLSDMLAYMESEDMKQGAFDGIRDRLALVEEKVAEYVEYTTRLESSLQESMKKQSHDLQMSLRHLRRDVSGLKQSVKRIQEQQDADKGQVADETMEQQEQQVGGETTPCKDNSVASSGGAAPSTPLTPEAALISTPTSVATPRSPTPNKRVYVSDWGDLFN